MDPDDVVTTRRSLHGVAELLMAGPQHRATGSIRLRVLPNGFAPIEGGPRLEDGELVGRAGRARPAGTFRELGERVGVRAGAPEGVYGSGSGVLPDDPVRIVPDALVVLVDWFVRGDAALRALGADGPPVLWPEHFDVGVVQDEVNYGVSPGDALHPLPYAYVGPWRLRTGPFWNTSFGALCPATELPDREAVETFLLRGRRAAREDPVSDPD